MRAWHAFMYDPYDIKAIFHPAYFVVFNGLNAGEELKEISFLAKAKKGDEILRSKQLSSFHHHLKGKNN